MEPERENRVLKLDAGINFHTWGGPSHLDMFVNNNSALLIPGHTMLWDRWGGGYIGGGGHWKTKLQDWI